VSFALDARADRDILRWLDQQDNRSAAIRQAIRAQIGGQGVTLGDLYQAIQDLRRGGLVVAAQDEASAHIDEPSHGEPVEPPDVAAALDNLGL
jgi:DNA-binding PadR family transcriptional regulator